MNQRRTHGRITAECRRDGSSIASELFATYPVRFHLTSCPNNDICMAHHETADPIDDETVEIKEKDESSVKKALTCYVLGYGGGLISGDIIDLQIKVKPGASLVVTSQSTTKAFKAINGRPTTCVKTTATVGRGSLLFLVPQPTQCFGGSRLEQETHIFMDHRQDECISPETKKKIEIDIREPSLLLVDWYTGGRSNLDGGTWQFDSFRSTTTISYQSGTKLESKNDDKNRINQRDQYDLTFRDATRLSGGAELKRHMRNFNVVCMVVLIGPRVSVASDLFLKMFSSRHTYEGNVDSNLHFGGEKGSNNLSNANNNSNPDYNRGEGLNNDDFLVSCGEINTANGVTKKGVILRVAASTLEKAAMFLSKYIGTLDDQLQDDPFLEILASKQGAQGVERDANSITASLKPNNNLSVGLITKSFTKEYSSVVENKENKEKALCSTNKADYSSLQSIGSVSPLILYQLVDSCAPTGGFAHSNTLETAHQLHLLSHSKSLQKNLLIEHAWDVILQTFTSIVPFLLSSCRLLRSYSIESRMSQESPSAPPKSLVDKWESIDAKLNATITSHVASRASSLQGSGILRAFPIAFPHIAPIIKALKKRVLKVTGNDEFRGHSATSFGAVCGLLGINDKTCVSMYLYTTSRDIVNAAVRMNLVGPLEGGRLTNILCSSIEELIASDLKGVTNNEIGCQHSIFNLDEELLTHSAHQVAPLVEILSNAHDRLYTRLFNS